MSRFRAFLVHLLISVLVVGSFLAVTFFIWYPEPYFEADGAYHVVAVLAGVDVVLGPLLTLIVFKSGKPRLKLDLGIIAAIQLSAFLYGAGTIFTERPAYVVFVLDKFNTVPASKVDRDKIHDSDLEFRLFSSPKLVYTKFPHDYSAVMKIVNDVFNGGKLILYRSDLYTPIAKGSDRILRAAKPFSRLTDKEDIRKQLETRASRFYKGDPESLKYLPLVGKNKVMTMLLDPKTGAPVGFLDVKPG